MPSVVTSLVTLALHPATLAPGPRSCLLPLPSLLAGCRASAQVLRSVLCFHTLTKAFSRSPFLLTFLQNPRGCHPPSANSSPTNNSSPCAHRFATVMTLHATDTPSALKMAARQYDSPASWQYNRAAIMALVSGQRPGSNDVRALIGAGGMPPVAQPLLAVRRI